MTPYWLRNFLFGDDIPHGLTPPSVMHLPIVLFAALLPAIILLFLLRRPPRLRLILGLLALLTVWVFAAGIIDSMHEERWEEQLAERKIDLDYYRSLHVWAPAIYYGFLNFLSAAIATGIYWRFWRKRMGGFRSASREG